MQKVAIFTIFRDLYNYGQILQAYALTTYLNQSECDAYLVDYRYDIDRCFLAFENNPNLKSFLKIAVKSSFIYPLYLRWKDKKHFISFKNKYLKLTNQAYNTVYRLRKNPPSADCCVSGSDQIWSVYLPRPEIYFLAYTNGSSKKVAYASSFGRSSLSVSEQEKYAPLLSAYNAIGVREESGVDICSKMGCKSEWVPDPTILLSKADYSKIMHDKSPFKSDKKKVFVYIVGCDNDEKLTNAIKGLKDAEVIISADNMVNGLQNSNLSIPEWIRAINDCDMVLTNSFHGTMFSLIFNKDFYVFERVGKSRMMNVRVNSILNVVQLKSRLISECARDFRLVEPPIDWDTVSEKFSRWRNIGEKFIRENILKNA